MGKANIRESRICTHNIERSESYIDSMNQWKADKKDIVWLQMLFGLIDRGDERFVDILDSEHAHGWMFYLSKFERDVSDAPHVFDAIKERTKEQGYVCHLADTRIFKHPDYVEQKDRYFLKPRFEYCEESRQFIQRFGNIMVELIFHNEKPHILKICAHSYKDRKYAIAEDFTEYSDYLFGVS